MPDKLILRLSNEMGNQMFMYATAYSISKQLNRKLYIDDETAFLSRKNVSKFRLNFFNITSAIAPDTLKFKNLSGYIKREVLLSCITKVKDFFALNKWQFNQPIVLSDIYTDLAVIEGVQSVISVEVKNKWDADLGYSGNVYDIEEATKNDIIYPSMDPAVFEVKFPDSDIKGKVTTT